MSMARTFLAENDVEFSTRFWKELRRHKKGSRALTIDRIPTQEELRRIVTQLPLNGKSLFLLLASSGMRIGEALKLRITDIDFDKNPAEVRIRGEYTKTGNQRLTFISDESKEILEEWLKVRSKFLRKYGKNDEGCLFPFNYKNAVEIWGNALTRTGLAEKDRGTNWHVLHPHVLRKFFRTRTATKMPLDVTEALMGHEGYLTEVYRRYSDTQLAEFYKSAEATVTVFGTVEDSKEIKDIILDNLKMRSELERMTQKMSNLEDFQNQWMELVNDFKAMKVGVAAEEAMKRTRGEPAYWITNKTGEMIPIPVAEVKGNE